MEELCHSDIRSLGFPVSAGRPPSAAPLPFLQQVREERSLPLREEQRVVNDHSRRRKPRRDAQEDSPNLTEQQLLLFKFTRTSKWPFAGETWDTSVGRCGTPLWGDAGHLHWEMHTKREHPSTALAKLTRFRAQTPPLFRLANKALEAAAKATET